MSAIMDYDIKLASNIWGEKRYDLDNNDQWQIIFITNDDLDYCREQQPSFQPLADVVAWARDQINNHVDISTAKIERF